MCGNFFTMLQNVGNDNLSIANTKIFAASMDGIQQFTLPVTLVSISLNVSVISVN